jgi:diacylglycerol kinase (ATP)
MRLVVYYNPIAGRGRAAATAHDIEAALAAGGHAVSLVQSTSAEEQPSLVAALRNAEGLVVAGGDGSLRSAAPVAAAAEVPLYQYPLGTENLFAREFGMDRSIDTLHRALASANRPTFDMASVNGRPFVLMVSVGFDADVVHDVCLARRGSISHLAYVGPILRRLTRWHAPVLSVETDGETLVRNAPGLVVVANCRQYAFRVNPCPDAVMDDGLLDVAFVPAAGRLALLRAALLSRMRRLERAPGVRRVKAKSVRVAAAESAPYQVDGDAAQARSGDASAPSRVLTTPLEIQVVPAVLRVMVP